MKKVTLNFLIISFFHRLSEFTSSNFFYLLHYLLKIQIDGSRQKEVVFGDIYSLLSEVQNDKVKRIKSGKKF